MSKNLPWKVNYIDQNGKKDSLWFGGLVDENEKNNRLKKLSENGFKVLSCYHVKSI